MDKTAIVKEQTAIIAQMRANLAPTVEHLDPVARASIQMPNPNFGLLFPQHSMGVATDIAWTRFGYALNEVGVTEETARAALQETVDKIALDRSYDTLVEDDEAARSEWLDGEHKRLMDMNREVLDTLHGLFTTA